MDKDVLHSERGPKGAGFARVPVGSFGGVRGSGDAADKAIGVDLAFGPGSNRYSGVGLGRISGFCENGRTQGCDMH